MEVLLKISISSIFSAPSLSALSFLFVVSSIAQIVRLRPCDRVSNLHRRTLKAPFSIMWETFSAVGKFHVDLINLHFISSSARKIKTSAFGTVWVWKAVEFLGLWKVVKKKNHTLLNHLWKKYLPFWRFSNKIYCLRTVFREFFGPRNPWHLRDSLWNLNWKLGAFDQSTP